MSRWHEPSCSRPKVQILGGLPCCMDCFAVASLDDIEVGSALRGPREPPTDESRTFNLTWPSCVNYIQGKARGKGGPSGSTDAEVPELEPSPSAMLESSQTDEDKKTEEEDAQKNLKDGPSTSGQFVPYQALLNPGDIRLMELDPGEADEILHASFSRANLSSKDVTYSALSYTWADDSGNADLCRPLFMGPFWDVIPITRSCEQALRSVRPYTGASRTVWVDSVCINQTDNSERSSQVALMSQIYSTASEVLVYLGPSRDQSDMALAAITRSLLHIGCGHVTSAMTCKTCSEAIRQLLQRPYFRRLWVVQEVVLSKQVSIHCGSSSALWPRTALTDRVQFAAWAKHREPRGGPHGNSDPAGDLISLLLDTRECLCQDPRDKVFALLGLIKGWKDSPIVANYEISIAAVWTGIAAYLITNGRGRETLFLAGIHRDRERGLPSWVPDISQLPSVDAWLNTLGLDSYRRGPWPPGALSTFPFRLSIKPQSPSSIRVHSETTFLHVSAVRICNVRERFTLDTVNKDSPYLILKIHYDLRQSIELQATVRLPTLPILAREQQVQMEDVFSDQDCIYWLHGIKGYAILRPGPKPATFTLVCACELIFSCRGRYENRSFTVRRLNVLEKPLSQQIIEWADTTEELSLRLRQSQQFVPRDLAQTFTEEYMDPEWRSESASFTYNAFDLLEVTDADSIDTIEQTPGPYRGSRHVSDNGMESNYQYAKRRDFWSTMSGRSSWNWDDMSGSSGGRWDLWRLLHEEEWMGSWRSPERWGRLSNDFGEQLAIRLRMRLLGFEVDSHEDVIIQ